MRNCHNRATPVRGMGVCIQNQVKLDNVLVAKGPLFVATVQVKQAMATQWSGCEGEERGKREREGGEGRKPMRRSRTGAPESFAMIFAGVVALLEGF